VESRFRGIKVSVVSVLNGLIWITKAETQTWRSLCALDDISHPAFVSKSRDNNSAIMNIYLTIYCPEEAQAQTEQLASHP